MKIIGDDEAEILRAIRLVPVELSDDAWKYVASRLRPIRSPTSDDVHEIAVEVISRYAAHHRRTQ